MTEGEVNQQPVQLLVNYWEIRPSFMGDKLNELIRQGVTHICAFVPWQAVESDISHRLLRFIQAVAERKMTVSLIVTPEVGVHYPNAGLPKDIIGKPEAQAIHAQGRGIPVTLPPNSFPLPSLLSPELTKRYYRLLQLSFPHRWISRGPGKIPIGNPGPRESGAFWQLLEILPIAQRFLLPRLWRADGRLLQ
jgi:hypothetical protein